MKKTMLLAFCFMLLASCFMFHVPEAQARVEGFYIGGGYEQPFIFTWKKQSGTSDRISMFPAVGAFLKAGYAFPKVDWFDLAVPIDWHYIRLNKQEWVMLINGDIEAAFHLGDPEKKFDPYIMAFAGFVYMTEGKLANESASIGPDVGAGFGFRYTLSEYANAGSTRVKNLSLMVEIPIKLIMFVNDYDLSDSYTTTVIDVPIRAGITYSF